MKHAKNRQALPENFHEYHELCLNNLERFGACLECSKPFLPENVFTGAGWRETQISGYCESCYDKLFPIPEAEYEPEENG